MQPAARDDRRSRPGLEKKAVSRRSDGLEKRWDLELSPNVPSFSKIVEGLTNSNIVEC